MENKNGTKEVQLQATTTAAKAAKIETELSKKLAYFTNLQKKVNQRAACQNHLDKLNALNIPDESQFSETDHPDNFGISIKTGYREEYLIKNIPLMLKLRDYLKTEINTAMLNLDTQILTAEI